MVKMESIKQANQVIRDFTASEWATHNRRAKVCGCVNCKTDKIDADDRADWLTGIGRWRVKRILVDKGSDGTISVDDLPFN